MFNFTSIENEKSIKIAQELDENMKQIVKDQLKQFKDEMMVVESNAQEVSDKNRQLKAAQQKKISQNVREQRREAYRAKMQALKRKKRKEQERRYGWKTWSEAENQKMIQLCRKHGYLTRHHSDDDWFVFYQAFFPRHSVTDVRHQMRQAHGEFSRLQVSKIQDIYVPQLISNSATFSRQKIRNLST